MRAWARLAAAGFLFEFFVDEQAGAVGGGGGEFVAAVVVGVIGVAPDPDEADGIFAGQFVVMQPEVFILFSSFEVGGDPVVQPALFDGFDDVLAIGVDGDVQIVAFSALQGRR